MERREFIKAVAATTAVSLTGVGEVAQASDETGRGGMPYRPLGRTGESVSAVGLGGYHIGTQRTEAESIALIRVAIDGGINFMDNCWDYRHGASEIRMGKALRDGYREKVFLMTKIDGRDTQTAAAQIDESLRRLQTDVIDLMQFHEVIRFEDPDRIFAEGGALEAVQAAQQAGKIRFIGFTGHKDPQIHLRMLQVAEDHDFRFDAVQMPLNVMDAHFRSFEKLVLPELVRQGIGVLGMKSMGGGAILRSGTVTAVECLHYAMSLPTSTVIRGINTAKILKQDLDAARSFVQLSSDELAAVRARTAAPAATGKFEKFKTTSHFDGTTRNLHWLSGG